MTIARTLVGNPELLRLDEPFEGLAPLVVTALLDDVRGLKGQGMTIPLAEQGVDFALALANRVNVAFGKTRHAGPAAGLCDDQDLRNRLLSLQGGYPRSAITYRKEFPQWKSR